MKQKPQTYIYFIGALDVNRVKIGCSRAPLARMEALLDFSPVPLEILAFTAGTFEDERRVQSLFREEWHHREWFNVSPRLKSFIAYVRATGELGSEVDRSVPIGPVPNRSRRGLSSIGARALRPASEKRSAA